MKTITSSCLEIQDNGEPVAVVLFKGKEHTFYRIEKCGMEDIQNIINRNLAETKI